MSIKNITDDKDLFIPDNKNEMVIESKGKKITFYANTISYFDAYNIGVQPKNKNRMALLVAASITDKDGNKFTYDEVLRLKETAAKPFFEAALKANTNLTKPQKETKGTTKKNNSR